MNVDQANGDTAALLELRSIGKKYGAVTAVQDVTLEVHRGEVLAICGDNGAGKSSLIKIVSGAEEPTSGTISLRGNPVRFRSPHDALQQGVATIYQDLALAPRLSVAANVFLGSELTRSVLPPVLRVLDKKRMAAEAQRYLAQLSAGVTDMNAPVERLSGGQRQAVAIARALRWQAEIIIMDEPTAALGVKETELVLNLVKRLKRDGKTVILISHNMRDVVSVADRVVILKGGRKYAERSVGGMTADDLSHLIMSDAVA